MVFTIIYNPTYAPTNVPNCIVTLRVLSKADPTELVITLITSHMVASTLFLNG